MLKLSPAEYLEAFSQEDLPYAMLSRDLRDRVLRLAIPHKK